MLFVLGNKWDYEFTKHPKPCPFKQAMGVICWYFGENLTPYPVLFMLDHVWQLNGRR